MHLNVFSEIVGTLTDVVFKEGKMVISFSLSQEIEVPNEAIQKEKIENLIGKKIGLFNNNGNYKIRKIKKRG